MAVYLMRKFRWTLYKTLEFLHSRRPDLEIRTNFFNQLVAVENKFAKTPWAAKTFSWEDTADPANDLDSEELLLRNTFLNTRVPADAMAAPSPQKQPSGEPDKQGITIHCPHHGSSRGARVQRSYKLD
jgi:hypothetical protein